MTDEHGPQCECHGISTRWAVDPKMKNGGRWRCRVIDRFENRPESYRLVNMVGCRRRYRNLAWALEIHKLLTLKTKREVSA